MLFEAWPNPGAPAGLIWFGDARQEASASDGGVECLKLPMRLLVMISYYLALLAHLFSMRRS